MNLTRDLLSVLLPGRGLLLLVVVVLEPHLVLALRPRLLHLVLQVPHQLKEKKALVPIKGGLTWIRSG